MLFSRSVILAVSTFVILAVSHDCALAAIPPQQLNVGALSINNSSCTAATPIERAARLIADNQGNIYITETVFGANGSAAGGLTANQFSEYMSNGSLIIYNYQVEAGGRPATYMGTWTGTFASQSSGFVAVSVNEKYTGTNVSGGCSDTLTGVLGPAPSGL